MFSEEVKKLAKKVVEAISYIKEEWEWNPEVGESCISKGDIILISGVIDVPLVFGIENRRLQYLSLGKIKEVFVKDVIPIPHWEKLKEIIEDAGYEVEYSYEGPCTSKPYYCRIKLEKDQEYHGIIEYDIDIEIEEAEMQLVMMKGIIELKRGVF